MLDKLRKICYFLRLVDEEPRLDLPDLAFMVILGKILFAHNLDWMAITTLAIAAMNSAHNRQVLASSDVQDMSDKLQNLENTVVQLKAKI